MAVTPTNIRPAIELLYDVFAIHALRAAIGMESRIPLGIWLMLLLTALAMTGVGYQMGFSGSIRSMACPILAFSFALVIALTAELDRPNGGFIRVTQQPLIKVQSWMSQSSETAARAATRPTSRRTFGHALHFGPYIA